MLLGDSALVLEGGGVRRGGLHTIVQRRTRSGHVPHGVGVLGVEDALSGSAADGVVA